MNPHIRQIVRSALALDQPRSIKAAILELLDAGPMSPNQLALILRKRPRTTRIICRQLLDEGLVFRNGHKYSRRNFSE